MRRTAASIRGGCLACSVVAPATTVAAEGVQDTGGPIPLARDLSLLGRWRTRCPDRWSSVGGAGWPVPTGHDEEDEEDEEIAALAWGAL
jgi:hypothetical protein